MQHFAKHLLAIGITAGLADRESFIKKVSGVIEEYQQDPEKAEKWAKLVVAYLEQIKDDIRMQQVMESSINNSNAPAKKDIEQLTDAIRELTIKMQEQKK